MTPTCDVATTAPAPTRALGDRCAVCGRDTAADQKRWRAPAGYICTPCQELPAARRKRAQSQPFLAYVFTLVLIALVTGASICGLTAAESCAP